MKKLNLLVLLFALLLTACSDSENEDPNGGGGANTSKIVGLNIKDAKLIYGVDRSSAKSMLKSDNPYAPKYFRQITIQNENMPVNWVKENGDTTSTIHIDAIAKLTNDYLLVTTQGYLEHPGLNSMDVGGYVVNKSTGKIINPENRFSVKKYSDGYDNFASYYDGDRYCYITTSSGVIEKNIVRIDFKTSETKTLLDGCDDVKMLSNGSFFAHMIDGKYKYGSLLYGEIHEFTDMERYKDYDSYLPVRTSRDDEIRILAIKYDYTENEWGEKLNKIDIINFSAVIGSTMGSFDDRLDDERFSIYHKFSSPLHGKIPMSPEVIVNSVRLSNVQDIIYLRIGRKPDELLLKYQNTSSIVEGDGLYKLADELLPGFSSDKFSSYENNYPTIAKNSKAAFNLISEKGIVITKFADLSQQTIERYGIFPFNGIIGNYDSDKPITFTGYNWEKKKQCVGTIDSEGNAEILQIFSSEDNEAMNGFLLELE